MDKYFYDVALSLSMSLSAIEKIALFKSFNGAAEIFSAKSSTLKSILHKKSENFIIKRGDFLREAETIIRFMEKASVGVRRFDDRQYPKGLNQIPDKPFLIFYRGNIDFDYTNSVSIVGTRNFNDAGQDRTVRISKHYVDKGRVIVSGLAKGVDSMAHKAAVDNKSRTIAVFGCGIDRIYPAFNRSLAYAILDNNGGFISEHAPGVKAYKHFFPRRNRLIAGLTPVTVVTQAPAKSGSLITAYLAVDYNRRVICPRSINNDTFDAGLKRLIDDGASLMTFRESGKMIS